MRSVAVCSSCAAVHIADMRNVADVATLSKAHGTMGSYVHRRRCQQHPPHPLFGQRTSLLQRYLSRRHCDRSYWVCVQPPCCAGRDLASHGARVRRQKTFPSRLLKVTFGLSVRTTWGNATGTKAFFLVGRGLNRGFHLLLFAALQHLRKQLLYLLQ